MAAFPSFEILPVHVLVCLGALPASHSVPAVVLVVAFVSAYPAAEADPSYSGQSLAVAASQSSVDLELPSDVESRVEGRWC